MAGNGALAGLVAITAGTAFVDSWASVVIGLLAGAIVVLSVMGIDRLRLDDPVGAVSRSRRLRHLGHARRRPCSLPPNLPPTLISDRPGSFSAEDSISLASRLLVLWLPSSGPV